MELFQHALMYPTTVTGNASIRRGRQASWLDGSGALQPVSTIDAMRITLVQNYDDRWPGDFRRIAEALETELDGLFLRIEHVGSTAVPGMTAKPVIDLVGVVEPEELLDVIARLVAFGYTHEGDRGIPGREAFKPIDGRLPSTFPAHHLYVCSQGNRSLEEQLAFRDYLRAHPEEARRLSAHKRALCIEHDNDKNLYIAGKSDMVQAITRVAMADGACLAPRIG